MLCTAGSGTYCRIVSDLWDMMFSCIVRVNWGNSPGCFSGCPNTFPMRKWLKQEGETNQLDGYQLDFSSLVVSFVESSKAHRKGWVFRTPAPPFLAKGRCKTCQVSATNPWDHFCTLKLLPGGVGGSLESHRGRDIEESLLRIPWTWPCLSSSQWHS